MEEKEWDRTQRYIHKYNTHSAPKYAFAAALLQRDTMANMFNTATAYINHVLHPDTGAVCSYIKLAAGSIPGQSVAT